MSSRLLSSCITHATKILNILNKHNIDVPQDSKGDHGTQMDPGQYYHLGLEINILKCLDKLPDNVDIPQELCIPTFQSCHFKPFVIGIFHGNSKPYSVNNFLSFFVKEASHLSETGLTHSNKNVRIKIHALICDAPAKAFVMSIKGHTGYHGGGKCIQEGHYLKNRMTFPELDNQLRTNESFRLKYDEDHHTGSSALQELTYFDMVSQVPLDPMHLVYLGVTKRLLQSWHKSRQDVRIPNVKFGNMCQLIFSLKHCIPKDAVENLEILLYTQEWLF